MNRTNRFISTRLVVATLLGLGAFISVSAQADNRDRDHDRARAPSQEFHERRPVPRVAPPRAYPAPRAHLEIDARFGHNRYYPRSGYAYHTLPGGYYTTRFRGVPYYFHQGVWYRHNGLGYVVIRPPLGLFINVLPPFYTTVWFGGIPYYYADNVYYRWDATQSGYVVSNPPDGTTAETQPVDNEQTFVYPKNGQSEEQTAKDRYECYRWAVDQSGFDPTKTGGGVEAPDMASKRDDYKRAEAACLDARGYSVK